MDGNTERYSPDGLTEQIVDSLLRDVEVAARSRPRPTSALVDGTAAQRRFRRRARRSSAALVRALPVRRVVCDPHRRDAA